MNIEQVRELALSLPHVTEDLPFGPDVLVFRIGGKIFMAMGLTLEEPKITLKLKPEDSENLREEHNGIVPAFHWNKKHWNDLYLEQIQDALTRDLIQRAYALVHAGLPRKIKDELGNECRR